LKSSKPQRSRLPRSTSVFSREELNARLNLPVGNKKSLVITPRVRPEAFDEDSVDLRLGCYFLLPKRSHEPYFAPDEQTATSLYVKVHVPLGEYLVIPAHETVLGATLEFIKLPFDASGEILTKSSVARTFVVVETAPWIHPEYRGCLTLEIANVSNTPVSLYPGRPIGQLILLKTARRRKRSAKLKGSYFGPVAPEPPTFRNPQDELFDLGAETVSVIQKVQVRRTRSLDFPCGVL